MKRRPSLLIVDSSNGPLSCAYSAHCHESIIYGLSPSPSFHLRLGSILFLSYFHLECCVLSFPLLVVDFLFLFGRVIIEAEEEREMEQRKTDIFLSRRDLYIRIRVLAHGSSHSL